MDGLTDACMGARQCVNQTITQLDIIYMVPGARPTNDISIEFEIWPKFAMLLFNTYSADHNDILHTSRQLHCRDVRKISLRPVEHISN